MKPKQNTVEAILEPLRDPLREKQTGMWGSHDFVFVIHSQQAGTSSPYIHGCKYCLWMMLYIRTSQ